MEDLTGRRFGGYELKKLIGTGGIASIYKGFDEKLRRWVAIKVTPITTSGGAEKVLLARFRQEAQAIATLRHPNILTIYDYGEEEGWAYFVMEYVPGGSLKERIKSGKPFPWQRALAVIMPMAQALDFAHKQGVIHRDIKPANILMPQEDWPLLADFGLAKMQHSGAPHLTRLGEVLGTMAYAAPEQLLDGAVVDTRADIYSLGITLYELLASRLPFEAQTAFDFLMVRLAAPPIPLLKANPDAPAEFAPVLDKALAQDPEGRYPSMEKFSEALREVRYELSGSFVTLPPSAKKVSRKPVGKTSMIKTKAFKQGSQITPRLIMIISRQEIWTRGETGLIIGRAYKNTTPDIDLEPYGGSRAGVSRQHSRLVRQGNEWYVEDLGSTNSTFVNGVKVAPYQMTKIKSGDIIRCGQIELQFTIDEDAK